MKNLKNISLASIIFVLLTASCSKEKQYQSKLEGTWDIYKVEQLKNYYDIDSVITLSTIDDYGTITFTKEETTTSYQTMDVAYSGFVNSEYLAINGSNIVPFAYELFKGYVMMHGGLVEMKELYFEFENKKEMTLVIGYTYNPGGTAPFALQTKYYFKK